MNRICRQCGAEKPLWEFVDRSKQTGERRKIHRICAACRSERSKERYQQRRKEVLSYQKQYREKLKREMKLSITLDTLTARILKLSSDSQSGIVPAPFYSWWNTTDCRADSAVAPVAHEISPDHRF